MDRDAIRLEIEEHLDAARKLRYEDTDGRFWDRIHAARVLADHHGFGVLHAQATTAAGRATIEADVRDRRFAEALAILEALPTDQRNEEAAILEGMLHLDLADSLDQRPGRRDEQRRLYQRGIVLLEATRSSDRIRNGLSRAYAGLAKIDMIEESFERSGEFLQRASAAEPPSPAYQTMTHLFEGDLKLIQLRLPDAAASYGACLRISEERGITPQIAQASIGLGWVYLEEGRTDEARGSFLRALRAARDARAIGFPTTELAAHARLGVARADLGVMERSRAFSGRQARKTLDRINASFHHLPREQRNHTPFSSRVMALLVRARVTRASGYEPDARQDFEAALRAAGTEGFLAGLAHLAHGSTVHAYGDDDRPGEAARLLERAERIFERLGLPAWCERVREARGAEPVGSARGVRAALRRGKIRLMRHGDERGTLTWPGYPSIPLTRTEVQRFDTVFSRFHRNESVALQDLFDATAPGQQRHARDVFPTARLWEKGVFCEQRNVTTGRVVRGRYVLSLTPERRRPKGARTQRRRGS